MPTYNPKVIEPRWQQFWEQNKTFRTPDDSPKPKFYILDMFPYPSGAGLHVGHPEGYTATDILARYKRMRGFNVLHPMGWDAFGLPAEQYAIETGTHPRQTTQKNIDTFRRQIKMLGFSYDWDREVDTTDPKYFKWTQWIFLVLYDTWFDPATKRGRPIAELPIPADVRAKGEDAVRSYQDKNRLAYQSEVPVNWCPALGTVLANEEVVDGKSERGGHSVVRMPLRQWMLRITAYADRLLEDLTTVDWSEGIKELQRNWIGRSEGAEVDFVANHRSLHEINLDEPAEPSPQLRVFTTRPDTLYGATYMVLSPEHPLVPSLTTAVQQAAVEAYQKEAAKKSDMERTELAKKKSGVFTGAYAINPVNQEAVPIWIADYVLASYGTGAIMAVPAHDDRDFEFAKQFKLPIRPVVLPPAAWLKGSKVYQMVDLLNRDVPDQSAETVSQHELAVITQASKLLEQFQHDVVKVVEYLYCHYIELFTECFTGEGTAMNSAEFNGLSTGEFKKKITDWLEKKRLGERKLNYKLRDWLFSRQRYWGEPFPILHEVDAAGKPTGRVEALSPSELPLTLPEMEDYKPSGKPEPPLGKATSWVKLTRNGRTYLRETNTMPQWAGSCWYYLRFIDPKNDKAFCDRGKEKHFMPVDLYVGGAEHAVLHLLYSRFWHKVLFDRGHVGTVEPFQRLVNQGMILGEMEYTGFKKGQDWISATRVDSQDAKDKRSGEPYERVRLAENQVEKKGSDFVLKENPSIVVDARAYKMSKARGNVVNPDHVVDEYGADSLRLYEMFMGPLEATKPWSMAGVEGVYRFLGRVWRLIIDDRAEDMKLVDAVQDVAPDKDTLRMLHVTIQRVTHDLDSMSFNTAISAMMEFANFLTRQTVRPCSALNTFVLLLGPFAPHLAEELWRALGNKDTLAYAAWPEYDPKLTTADQIEVPVQINGKVRGKITVPAGITQEELQKIAMTDEKVAAQLAGKTIKKVFVVPGKLVNIVVG